MSKVRIPSPATWLACAATASLTALAWIAAADRGATDRQDDARQRDRATAEAFLAAVPQPGGRLEENSQIKAATAREHYLLTYPTGRMPSQPWDKARAWVARNVADARPWAGESLQAPDDSLNRVFTAPGTNTWVPFGPKPLDSTGTTNNAYQYGLVAGRVSVGGLAVDPVSPGTAYAGFAAGGLWKTTDIGLPTVTWTPLWEDKNFVSQSAGAIEIDPSDHNRVYVGTGDFDARDQFGAGIMVTPDGGTTWTQLGASVFTPFSPTHPAGGNRWDNQNIRTIKVDPNNPSTILVGTRYDLYISHDSGSTWQICSFGADPTDPTFGSTLHQINRISSIVLDARTATTKAYVAVGYVSTDANGNNGVYRFNVPSSGCPVWPTDFTTLFGGFPAGTGNGLAQAAGGSITGRIELASGTGSDGALTLYAQMQEAVNRTADGTYVLRPDGGSTTWTKLSGSAAANHTTCTGGSSSTGQDWYDLFIAVDPTNDKTIYTGHIDAFKATVNATYTSMTLSNMTNVYGTTCPSYGKVHPDQHALVVVPGTGGAAFLLGNDGGVFYNSNRGDVAAWKQLNDSLNTTQFYAGQIGTDFAGGGMGGTQWWFGGMQDNGNASWKSATPNLQATGRSVGGDGFFTTFDVVAGGESTGWWLTEYTYGSVYCSRNSGADGPFSSSCGPNQTGTADWSAPLMLDTLHCTNTQCRNYLFAEDYVHAAGAYGVQKPTWRRVSANLTRGLSTSSIIAVNFAPNEPKAAVIGTNDGKVWWSNNIYTGASCTQAAANTSTFSCSPNTGATWRDADSTNAVLPNRAILGVAVDPTDSTRVYAAVGGFNSNTPTTPGHLIEMKWNGATWTRADKTGNLPDVPASAVAVNPHNRKQVFVGTHFGFYYTDDIDAASPVWTRYQWGLPNTIIRFLAIDRGPAATPGLGTTLAAFTYGRGVYAIKLPTTGTFPSH